jgi:hypothetical protein
LQAVLVSLIILLKIFLSIAISSVLYLPFDEKESAILTYLANGEIDMVINIPKTAEKVELDSDYIIRRKEVDLNIPLFTNVQATKRFI